MKNEEIYHVGSDSFQFQREWDYLKGETIKA